MDKPQDTTQTLVDKQAEHLKEMIEFKMELRKERLERATLKKQKAHNQQQELSLFEHLKRTFPGRWGNAWRTVKAEKNLNTAYRTWKQDSREQLDVLTSMREALASKPSEWESKLMIMLKCLVGSSIAFALLVLLRFQYAWLSSMLPGYLILLLVSVLIISLFTLFVLQKKYWGSYLRSEPFSNRIDIWLFSLLTGFVWNCFLIGDEPVYENKLGHKFFFHGSPFANAMQWTAASWWHVGSVVAPFLLFWLLRACLVQQADNSTVDSSVFDGDQPLTSALDDLFARKEFAKRIARILNEKNSESMTIGLYGEWGSGKSSFLQMIKEFCPDHAIFFEFKPWYFGQDNHDIIRKFLSQFADELRTQNGYNPQIEKALKEYIRAVSNIQWRPDGWTLSMKEFIEKWTPLSESESLTNLKKTIETQMQRLGRPVVVLIDDIDRLDTDEIRMVFKLVRLVADFPNVTYLLALDDTIVAEALAKDFPLYANDTDTALQKGRDYMEKFIQIPLPLPLLPASKLIQMCWQRIEDMKLRPEMKPLVEQGLFCVEKNKFFDHLSGFSFTPRKVKRYLNTLEALLPLVRDRVNIDDFLYLILLKIFAPDLYNLLRDPHLKDCFLSKQPPQQIKLLGDFKNKYAKYEVLLAQLLPYSIQLFDRTPSERELKLQEEAWIAIKRICSPKVYDRYFIYGLPDGQVSEFDAAHVVDQLLAHTDHQKLKQLYDAYVEDGDAEDCLLLLKVIVRNRTADEQKMLIERLIVLYEFYFTGAPEQAEQWLSLIEYLAIILQGRILDTSLLAHDTSRNLRMLVEVFFRVRPRFLFDVQLSNILLTFQELFQKFFAKTHDATWELLNLFIAKFITNLDTYANDVHYRQMYYANLLHYIPYEALNELKEEFDRCPENFVQLTFLRLVLITTDMVYDEIAHSLQDMLESSKRQKISCNLSDSFKQIITSLHTCGDPKRFLAAKIKTIFREIDQYNKSLNPPTFGRYFDDLDLQDDETP